ncbi:MAG: BBE domain-containing protein [Rhodomicrobium sp.]
MLRTVTAADEGEARIADAYNARSFARLRVIKAKYDPGNLFRMNQNIRPAPASQFLGDCAMHWPRWHGLGIACLLGLRFSPEPQAGRTRRRFRRPIFDRSWPRPPFLAAATIPSATKGGTDPLKLLKKIPTMTLTGRSRPAGRAAACRRSKKSQAVPGCLR